MARWGTSRDFDRSDATVKLLPHVETGKAWHTLDEPIEGTIDQLMLIDMRGDRTVANAILDSAIKRYLGRPYSEWTNG
jgi:hypothetical protein